MLLVLANRPARPDRPAAHTKGEAVPSAADELSKTAASRMLSKRIKDIVGVSTEIIVGDPGEIERSQGKAKRVLDNRDAE